MSMDWKSDPYVKAWFAKVGARSVHNYSREFPKFLEFVNKTPSEIIDSRIQNLMSANPVERRFWEEQVVLFKKSLEKKGLRKATIHGYIRTAQSFFANNSVRLQFGKKELHIEPSEKDKVIREWIPTNEEVRLIYKMATNARDRALLLVLYQSGLSPVDVAGLRIEELDLYDENGNWRFKGGEDKYIDRLREKTDVEYQTCISREALDDLRIYLQGRGNPKEGALFLSHKNQPLSERFIHESITSIVERTFKGRDWKTKHLRDAYKNGLVQAKLPQETIDMMFGHTRSGAKKDYRLTEETIRQAYQEAFKFLTVNGFGSTNRKLEEVSATVEKQQQMIEEQRKMIEELQEKVKWLSVGKLQDY